MAAADGKIRVVVIGGGISGLATAWLIREELAPLFPEERLEITLLEAAVRPGGKIWTECKAGYRLEAGPNGFLDSKPWTLDLVRKLGIEDQLLPSNDLARKRYIYFGGRLHQLPENPVSFLRSGLLSWRGKLRIMAEYWQPRYTGTDEETLARFARRRLGEEAYQRLLDPMVTGIFAGNPETMSLRSAFPRIWELEQEYGGLLKAMLTLMRRSRKEGKKRAAGPAGPGGVLTTFREGLDYLTNTLAARLAGSLITGCPVRQVERTAAGFTVAGAAGAWPADVVVSAATADAAGEYLNGLEPELAAECRALPYSPMAVAGLGFRQSDLPQPLNGFGFLIPCQERRDILGVLWSSSIFPGYRAPEDHVLLTVMLGGARRLDLLDWSDGRVLEVALGEVAHTMGIKTRPAFARIFRWERAIPQYNAGHFALRRRIEAVPGRQPGLWITGNAFHGIGVNDCCQAAFRIAAEVRDHLRPRV